MVDGKMCSICRKYKSITEFGKRMYRGKNIGHSYCKTCKKAWDKEYEMTRRVKVKLYAEQTNN